MARMPPSLVVSPITAAAASGMRAAALRTQASGLQEVQRPEPTRPRGIGAKGGTRTPTPYGVRT
ncbi:exported hypothetical protein [Xanthomonas phaseoli pv. phaseoli]|nr:exported hypothetical protein [Xanthomonas phaseoli pv. phaseoli]